jgi:membrane associated rhomboid family serine protease
MSRTFRVDSYSSSMQIHVPDPAYTGSEQARLHFGLAVRLAFGFVVLIWLVHLMNWGLDLDSWPFGIRPREISGLPGIFLAPLVHGSFEHLIANSLPLLVLGTAMLFLYPASALRALPLLYLVPGVAVWFFGRDSVHLGASGLIYGLVSYVFVAGLLRRDRRAIASSLVVCFMYGSLTWGVVPTPRGVSWETHLAGALIGVLLAIVFRHMDRPPLKRYVWEGEEDVIVDSDEENAPPSPGNMERP